MAVVESRCPCTPPLEIAGGRRLSMNPEVVSILTSISYSINIAIYHDFHGASLIWPQLDTP
jgi:hypothetical protein